MKEQYETPLMELIQFESEDVIITSGDDNEAGWVDPIG